MGFSIATSSIKMIFPYFPNISVISATLTHCPRVHINAANEHRWGANARHWAWWKPCPAARTSWPHPGGPMTDTRVDGYESHGGKGWSIKHIKQCFFSAIYIYIQFDMEIIWDNDVQKVKPKFFWAGCPIFRQAIQWCVGIRVLSVIRIIIQIMMYPFRRVITIFITTTITEQIWNNDEWRPPHSTKSHIDYVWPSCGWTPQGSPFETAEVGEHRLGQGDLLWDTPYTISISEGAPVHCLSW